MTMSAHFDGRVFVPDGPVPLSIGRRVRVEVEPIDAFDDDPDPPGTLGDEQRNDPESIARWIAEYDSIPAAVMTAEEEAEWQAERLARKERDAAAMDQLIRNLPGSQK